MFETYDSYYWLFRFFFRLIIEFQKKISVFLFKLGSSLTTSTPLYWILILGILILLWITHFSPTVKRSTAKTFSSRRTSFWRAWRTESGASVCSGISVCLCVSRVVINPCRRGVGQSYYIPLGVDGDCVSTVSDCFQCCSLRLQEVISTSQLATGGKSVTKNEKPLNNSTNNYNDNMW